MYKPRKATPTIVYTPLSSQVAKGKGSEGAHAHAADASVAGAASKRANANPYLRAENEDDDGYDPYSDRREEEPLFEQNPWD